MEYERIIVRLVGWMPPGVTELVTKSCDGGEDYYTIFLNQNASQERIIKAYDHAIQHIEGKDFEEAGSVQQIETLRHAV